MRKTLLLTTLILVIIGLTATAQADTNLALTGIATQSSTGWGGLAGRAIDGNTDGSWYDNSVTHTDYEQGWWKVDLNNTYSLEKIVIWNRTDCCGERLSNFYVSVLDQHGGVVWMHNYFTSGGNPNPSLSINLPSNTLGEIVKVGLNGVNWLSLAEVQVFESTAVPEPCTMLLLGVGLVGLASFRKKFKRG